MSHPFARIPAPAFRAVFGPLLLLTLVAMAVLNLVGAPLATAAAPAGIVSFELAGTPAAASFSSHALALSAANAFTSSPRTALLPRSERKPSAESGSFGSNVLSAGMSGRPSTAHRVWN